LKNIIFANPEYFYLLLILPVLIGIYFYKRNKHYPTISFPSEDGYGTAKPSLRLKLIHIPFALRIIALALLIVVLARPQSSSSKRNVNTEGVDIVVAIDISTSMLAEDFKPNRLEAAKRTAMDFIDERIDDRIGLVIFASESFTQCPITIDHDVLKNLFTSIKPDLLEDGTAIGMGLATSISRLKDSKAKSKVIILLTDGMNNRGFIAPLTAAEIAKSYGIRVYSIGVGTVGMAPYPFKTPFGTQYQNVEVKIDEDVLKNIAGLTGGKYFRATSNKVLKNVYQEIDKLEKTRVDVSIFSRRSEEFLPYAIGAALLFILEIFLRYTVFRKVP
jgi:Ca-activated chloride channel family protein